MKYLLLLGADQFLRELAIVAAIAVYGENIVAVNSTGAAEKSRFFKEVLEADPKDKAAVLAVVQEYQQKTGAKPEAVIAVNDWTLESAREVADTYDLPFHSMETIKKSRNKHLMKQAFEAHSVPTPKHFTFNTLEELKSHIGTLNLPVVIKPRDFGGSGGVVVIRENKDIQSAFEHCSGILNQYAPSFHLEAGQYQVEQYVPADREVSIEVINTPEKSRVLAVTEKFLSPEPYFAEMGHIVPSLASDDAKLKEIALNACNALGIKQGMAHVEIRIKDNEYYVMEVGARPGGDGIMDQVKKVYDINPYVWHIQTFLPKGQQPDLNVDLQAKGMAGIFFLKAENGVIKEIKPLENPPANMSSLYIQTKVGSLSQDPSCWRDREGIVEFHSQEFDAKNFKLWPEEAKSLATAMFKVEPPALENTQQVQAQQIKHPIMAADSPVMAQKKQGSGATEDSELKNSEEKVVAVKL